MYTHQVSQSSEPMSTYSPEESIRTYGCKWAWCRSTFSDNAELVHHVIHDHARRAIPVRRRDIPLLRRAEEGTGESLEFSYAFTSQSSGSDRARNPSESASKETPQDVASRVYGASSSLPSPPTSSLAGFSPLPTSLGLPEDTPLSEAMQRTNVQFENPPHTPHQARDGKEHTFASLSSPADSATSFAIADIPNSPSFSSLVQNSVKRMVPFNAPDNLVASGRPSFLNHPLSQSTSSSTGSRVSVEQQLTQTPESDNEEETDQEEPVSNNADNTHGLLHRTTNLYTPQPRLDPSQKAEMPSFEPQSHNLTQESEFHPANYDLLSQAPSQFQVDCFPYHYHGPKSNTATSSQIPPQSTASLQLGSPAPLHSPKYATSTPQRQNWYQTHLVNHSVSPTVDKRSRDEDDTTYLSGKLERTPSRSGERNSLFSSESSPSKSKRFKSGTLHVPAAAHIPETTPEKSMQNDVMDDAPEDVNTHSQSSSSDTESMEDFSYPPLQTQAPYQSQSWSQF